jgi:hypothetical protein
MNIAPTIRRKQFEDWRDLRPFLAATRRLPSLEVAGRRARSPVDSLAFHP